MVSVVKEEVKIIGWVEIEVRDRFGRLKYYLGRDKIVVCDGDKCENHPILIGTVHGDAGVEGGTTKWFVTNIITNVGLDRMIKRVFGIPADPFIYLAIGDGSPTSPGNCPPESPTDTRLGREIARKPASITQVTTSVTNDTARLEATFSSADGLSGTSAICEAGIFDAPSGGNMLARRVFPVANMVWDYGDTFTIRYFVQLSR
jgi:hypothetical protein